MKNFSLIFLSLAASLAQAKLYFDYEADPLPLIKINILIPSSRAFKSDTDNLGLKLLEECFEAGTQSLNKQKYQDALATFGASLDISAGHTYEEVNLTFPLNAGKIPQGLVDLLRDSLDKPRITAETFERVRKLVRANYMSTLERDSSLLITGMHKILSTTIYDTKPYETATFDRMTQAMVEDLHKNYYTRANIWVGVIAPLALKQEILGVMQGIFPSSGPASEGMLQSKLENGFKFEQKGKLAPTFLLIDKKDLAQIDYGFIRVNKDRVTEATELTDNFINFGLTRAGVDSIYGRRIRSEKGLAYQVANIYQRFLDVPVISLFANPQRSKEKEAFEVLAQIIKDTFDKSDVFTLMPDAFIDGKLASYKNSERQEGATPEGRIRRRRDVVTDDLSYRLFKLPIDDWNVSKAQATKRLVAFSKNSSMVAGVIGDASELEPLVKKHFAQYKIIKITYKDVLSNDWLKK